MASAPSRPKSRTIRSYEESASDYIKAVSPRPPRYIAGPLRRLAALVRPGGRVLEVGSGTGRDADFLESLGVRVRRTELTRAFREAQAARGKRVERLDILRDPFGGPYDGLLAMCVLIHIPRSQVDRVLRKTAKALRPGGGLLVGLWEGRGSTTGRYHMTYWTRDTFAARLAAAGLVVEWDRRLVKENGDVLLLLLARKEG